MEREKRKIEGIEMKYKATRNYGFPMHIYENDFYRLYIPLIGEPDEPINYKTAPPVVTMRNVRDFDFLPEIDVVPIYENGDGGPCVNIKSGFMTYYNTEQLPKLIYGLEIAEQSLEEIERIAKENYPDIFVKPKSN